MSKKMNWCLGVLILLICTAFVFMTIRDRAEIRQLEQDLAAAEKLKKDLTQQPKADNKPPGASPNGHLHDGERHDDQPPSIVVRGDAMANPDVIDRKAAVALAKSLPRLSGGKKLPLVVELENPVIGSGVPIRTVDGDGIDIDWEALSADELATAIQLIKQEQIPLPEGYYYRILMSSDPLLDERGFPILHKKGEPFISLRWVTDFRPPPDVYAEYKALSKRYFMLKGRGGSSPELKFVSAQIDELEARPEYRGPLPVMWQVSTDGAATDEEVHAQKQRAYRKMEPIKKDLFRQMGYDYIYYGDYQGW